MMDGHDCQADVWVNYSLRKEEPAYCGGTMDDGEGGGGGGGGIFA